MDKKIIIKRRSKDVIEISGVPVHKSSLFYQGYEQGKLSERKRILEIIDSWAFKNTLKYEDDCSYCQRNIAQIVIYVKELKQTIQEKT